ncbi:MAG TPA: YggT family protein [Pyrinomonadaceae bacterium]|nr:YggT family protein [Pyrinomonadaceae bacterium]
MIAIERIFWFLDSAFIAFIVAVILLMIVRMIVDKADLNPFGATHRTVRRMTDTLVFPARGALREFRADPKFAPLIVIVVVILFGFMGVQFLGILELTVINTFISLERGNIPAVIGTILYGLISVYILIIFVRVIFSMARVSYTNRVMRFLVNLTEPLLGPLRRMIPLVRLGSMGMMDISPIVAFIILWVIQAAISGTLLRGMRF